MVWAIEFDEAAKKELAKLDRQVAKRLLDFLKQRIISLKDPAALVKPLKAPSWVNFGNTGSEISESLPTFKTKK